MREYTASTMPLHDAAMPRPLALHRLTSSLQATAPAEARGSRVTLQSLHGGGSTAVGCPNPNPNPSPSPNPNPNPNPKQVGCSMQCVQPLGEAQLLGQVSYVDGTSAEQRVLSFKVPP